MVFEKTVAEIVEENYVYARALHYLGFDFFEDPHRKLGEICKERGLDKNQVIKSFYEFDTCPRLSFSELGKYPIELLTQYLKHSHHVFIKDKLPYIVHLAKSWKKEMGLSQLLPEFVEDFIAHIYEEEDSTFKYIELLSRIKKGAEKAPVSKLMHYQGFSLQEEFEHHKDDDEFGAIRDLIDGVPVDCVHARVLIKEIKAFDREMIYHAQIENNIFFPKAIALEKEVITQLDELSQLN